MSITPLHPAGMPPVSPEPQPGGMDEGKIIRRFIWRQIDRLLFVLFGLLLGALLLGRQADNAILAARAETEQCVTQLVQLRAAAQATQTSSPLLEAAGAMLGIPPQVTKMVAPALSQMVDEAARNLERSSEAEQAVRKVGQDRVISTLFEENNCGTMWNADCILTRMCEPKLIPQVDVKADACHSDVECWRSVLTDCGGFK